VLHLRLIILLLGCDVPIDNDALLVTDFINLKIKSVQSFGVAHTGRVYIYIYTGECSYVYEYLHLYCVFKKTQV
jgi:hypothetical protein